MALASLDAPKVRGVATAFAAGMMLGASLFLIPEGLTHDRFTTLFGVLLGIAAVYVVEALLEKPQTPKEERGQRRGLLLFLVMFFHSIPEGTAIGVGFATDDLSFGLTTAIAIAIHNIPEGIAISLPLRLSGASFARCFAISVASSLPQPIVALPALYFTSRFLPLLPWGLGFAAGAMLYVALHELLPEARAEAGTRSAFGYLGLGLIAMTLSTAVLERLF